MVFSRQKMETAFSYISVYYDKILEVNLEEDKYEPIKVNDTEWYGYGHGVIFSEWLKDFALSELCHPYHMEDFMNFSNMDVLKSLNKPATLTYQKYIDGKYHDVLLEFIPIGDMRAYVFVKDITKMKNGGIHE